MAAALAHHHPATRPTPRRGVAPVALRLARPADAEVDLDAAWAAALAPHRIADQRDAHVAPVIDLDAHRAPSPRVARARRVGVLFVLALAVVLALGAGAMIADADGPTPVGQTVTVQPGQTLWDVAVTHTPDGADPRATLDQIRDLNGLTGTQVPAWTPLVLPAALGATAG